MIDTSSYELFWSDLVQTPGGMRWDGGNWTHQTKVHTNPNDGFGAARWHAHPPILTDIERLPHAPENLPAYADGWASGVDLAAAIDKQYTLLPQRTYAFPTGFKIALPWGWQLEIRSRSGNAAKRSLIVLNSPGTIDCNYHDELMVILHNAGRESQVIKPGDRIAQGVIMPLYRLMWNEVPKLYASNDRGGGLGSTGA